ncbi:hypothetical protein H012_gp778 [Acanthamoeba polyphaga moumouvirus]|uniref:Uncharacterized protein n=1 Tax=Acanthamoeba polyphaga moumouvirus TaxID=1269028 RepID=L7RBV1_9VIRU|nr:hypothetical protein H012_gp778 [Acanthamoeba polyphaga moumouvirus]AGC01687.1 hypothetical protein Moumou_00143 [Acanthamoeba polyphaga moumouvirus]AQN68025.1 hypothetical protein [Saudi moumouvirus]
MPRVFKFVDPETGLCYGKYNHWKPIRAASKAFSVYVKKIGTINPNTKYKIVIKECTINKPEKYFFYEACRKNYLNPQIVIINNKTITYKYYNILRQTPAFKIAESIKNIECIEDVETIEKNIEKNNPKSCIITIEI